MPTLASAASIHGALPAVATVSRVRRADGRSPVQWMIGSRQAITSIRSSWPIARVMARPCTCSNGADWYSAQAV